MTLLDLFNGNWTLGQLLPEIMPMLMLAVGAGLAGYTLSVSQGLDNALEILDQVDQAASKNQGGNQWPR